MMRLRRQFGSTLTALIIVAGFLITILTVFAIWSMSVGHIDYAVSSPNSLSAIDPILPLATSTPLEASSTPKFVPTHTTTPNPLKAVYFTSWAAGNQRFREQLFDLVETTEINAVVIDVKDYSGHISFLVEDPLLKETGAAEKRIPDIKEFIGELHDRGVYVIARISSFQDSYLIKVHPEWAVKTNDGNVWQDYKGVKWLDAGAKPVWEYLVAIGKEAYAVGFDELNFDYIRFPSDGNLKDIVYSWGAGRSRQQVLKDFFTYLHETFGSLDIPISADLFGLTTSAEDDLGIGQILEYALNSFDYVAPMVYPSHFGPGFNGYQKPAQFPYEVVKYSMDHAVIKAQSTTTQLKWLGEEPIASTTPQLYTKGTIDKNKLRPWLQAFDLGAIYTPEMVRKQIQATYDAGLTSWMLWNAGSMYQKEALLAK
ncbi:MAG: hypothetical protein RL536_679 [Candidatus Parcubacteria bacterium]|jgi:hypothetical protein